MPSSEAPANGSQHLDDLITAVYRKIENQITEQGIHQKVFMEELNMKQSSFSKHLDQRKFTMQQLIRIFETLHLKPEDMFKAADSTGGTEKAPENAPKAAGITGDAEKITQKITVASDKMSMKLGVERDNLAEEYYCYFMATDSEKKDREKDYRYNEGRLQINKKEDPWKINFTLEKWQKSYEGFLLFTGFNIANIILISENEADVSFISFELPPTTRNKFDYWIGSVLTMGAGDPRERYPTMHRMLFSIKKIEDETVIKAAILPFLRLNNRQLTIEVNEFSGIIKNNSSLDDQAVKRISDKMEEYLRKVYHIKNEERFLEILETEMENRQDALRILAKSRESAYDSHRNNKVSTKANTHIRDLITYLLPPTNASAEKED